MRIRLEVVILQPTKAIQCWDNMRSVSEYAEESLRELMTGIRRIGIRKHCHIGCATNLGARQDKLANNLI